MIVEAGAKTVESLFAERAKRLTEQGTQCSSASSCVPPGDTWKMWHSFDLDQEIRNVFSTWRSYCEVAPPHRCQAFQTVLRATQLGSQVGLPLSWDQWEEQAIWLNSDPRVAPDRRWGGARSGFRSMSVPAPSWRLNVGLSGLAEMPPELLAASPSITRIFDLPGGRELEPPAGAVWRGLDLTHDWALAAYSSSAAAEYFEVLHPKDRDPVFTSALNGLPAHEVSWRGPGIVMSGNEKERSLVDLTRTPIFEANHLSSALGAQSGTAWVSKETDGSHWLHSYQNGVLRRHSLSSLFESDDIRIRSLQQFNQTAFLGVSKDAGPQAARGQVFAVNLNTGKVLKTSLSTDLVWVSPDGKWATEFLWANGGMESALIRLNENFEAIERQKFDGAIWAPEPLADGTQLLSIRTVNDLSLFRYRAGAWEKLHALPDEDRFVEIQGEFIVALTQRKTQRVRTFGGNRVLFETEPGAWLSLAGTRDQGGTLSAVIVTYPPSPGSQSIYDLAHPELPLLTGEFFSGGERIVRSRGWVIPVSQDRSLWLENLQ